MMAIMQAAANRWGNIIEDNYTMTLNVRYSITPCGSLGCAIVQTPNDTNNRTLVGNVYIGSTINWYFDPTPNNDSEFDMVQTSYFDLSPTDQSAGFSGTNIEDQLEVGYQAPQWQRPKPH